MSTKTEAFEDACSRTGLALASATIDMWGTFNGGKMPHLVAFNALGGLAEAVFMNVPFEEPQHRLEEFDSWVKYTRERIIDSNKATMS